MYILDTVLPDKNLLLPEKAIKLLTKILKMPENNLEPLPHRFEKLKIYV
jgi:hypothetical protein